ncbi:polymorphic toxin-type HINT domain-containing protein [Deinococcus cellulosilyticus]|uniref:polymorphic toxin-type HINT domain-containing protein n=1 Tax=Deinococcus cellulosilyticus TaxID=401558 RepID=UPI001649857D|nr:polymorphic toxin-type HINT domain-containing protein [Deinococcus cellulosilyticus]
MKSKISATETLWIAHHYDHGGNRSTFFNDGDLVDFKQNLSQQFRGAQNSDPEGIGASPKTNLVYVTNGTGQLASVTDEWGRFTKYTWGTYQGSNVLLSIQELIQDSTQTDTSWTRQTRFAYGLVPFGTEIVLKKVMYIAQTGREAPDPTAVNSTCGTPGASGYDPTRVCNTSDFEQGFTTAGGYFARTFEFDYKVANGHVLLEKLRKPLLRDIKLSSTPVFDEYTYTYDEQVSPPRVTAVTSSSKDNMVYYYRDTSNNLLRGQPLPASGFVVQVDQGYQAPFNTSKYTLNNKGQVVQKQQVDGNQTLTWTYRYYANGYTALVTEPSGATTHFGYDTQGNLASETTYATSVALPTLPAGGPYNPAAQSGWVKRTESTFDGDNRLVRSFSKSSTDTTYGYSPSGSATEYQEWEASTFGTDPSKNQTFRVPKMVTTLTGEINPDLPALQSVIGTALKSTQSYDTSGRLTQSTSGNTTSTLRTTTYTYALGNRWSQMQVTSAASISQPSGPANQVIQYADQVRTVHDGLTTHQYFYDALGNVEVDYTFGKGGTSDQKVLVSSLDASKTPSYSYISLHQKSNGFGQLLFSRTSEYPSSSPIRQQSMTLYASSGELISSWEGNTANLTTYQYFTDSWSHLGQVKKVLWGEGNGTDLNTVQATRKTTEYRYDSEGRVLKQAVDGFQTEFAYDALGRMTTQKTYVNRADDITATPAGPVGTVTTTYDITGQPYTVTENVQGSRPVGGDVNLTATTKYTRDAFGQVTATQYPDATAAYQVYQYYDGYGRVVQTTDQRLLGINQTAADNSSYLKYDTLGRLLRVLKPALRTSDVNGKGYVDNRRPYVEYVYDDFGRKTFERELIGNSIPTLSSFYKSSYASGVPEGEFKITEFRYDNWDRLFETVSPRGYKTTLTLDQAGNGWKTEQEVLKGNEPGLNLPAQEITTYQSFDALGRVFQSFDGRGYERRRTYNLLGNVTSEIEPDSSGALIVRKINVYSHNGLLLKVLEPDVNTSSAVSPVPPGELSSQWTPTSYAGMFIMKQLVYSLRAYPASITVAHENNDAASGSEATTTYTYDADGRVQSEKLPSGEFTAVVTHRYDSRGLEIYTQSPEKFDVTRDFDGMGRLVTEHHWPRRTSTGAGAEAVSIDATAGFNDTDHPKLTFRFDRMGNLTEETRNQFVTKHVYNSLGQVVAETRSHDPSRVTAPLYRFNVYRVDGMKLAYTSFDYTGNITNGVSGQFTDTAGNLTLYELSDDGLPVIEVSKSEIRGLDGTSSARFTEYTSENIYDGRGLRLKRSFSGDGRVFDHLKRDGSIMTSNMPRQYTTLWNYDSVGNMLSRVDVSVDGSTVLSRFDYTYNAMNRQAAASGYTPLSYKDSINDFDRGTFNEFTEIYYNQRGQIIKSITKSPAFSEILPIMTAEYQYYSNGSYSEKYATSTSLGRTRESGRQSEFKYDLTGRIVSYRDSRNNEAVEIVKYKYEQNRILSYILNQDLKITYSDCNYSTVDSNTAKQIKHNSASGTQGANSLIFPANTSEICKEITDAVIDPSGGSGERQINYGRNLANYSFVVNRYWKSQLINSDIYPPHATTKSTPTCKDNCFKVSKYDLSYNSDAYGTQNMSSAGTTSIMMQCSEYIYHYSMYDFSKCSRAADQTYDSSSSSSWSERYDDAGTKLSTTQSNFSAAAGNSGYSEITSTYETLSGGDILTRKSVKNIRTDVVQSYTEYTYKRYNTEKQATQFYNSKSEDGGCNLLIFCRPSYFIVNMKDFAYDPFGNTILFSELHLNVTDSTSIKSKIYALKKYYFADNEIQFVYSDKNGEPPEEFQTYGISTSKYCATQPCFRDPTYSLADSVDDPSKWEAVLPFELGVDTDKEFQAPTPGSSVGLGASSVDAPEGFGNPFGVSTVLPPSDVQVTQNSTGVSGFSNPLPTPNQLHNNTETQTEPIDPGEFGPPVPLNEANPNGVGASGVADSNDLTTSTHLGVGQATLPVPELNPNLSGSTGSTGVVAPDSEMNPNLGGTNGTTGGNSGTGSGVESPDGSHGVQDPRVIPFHSADDVEGFASDLADSLDDAAAIDKKLMDLKLGKKEFLDAVQKALVNMLSKKVGAGIASKVEKILEITQNWPYEKRTMFTLQLGFNAHYLGSSKNETVKAHLNTMLDKSIKMIGAKSASGESLLKLEFDPYQAHDEILKEHLLVAYDSSLLTRSFNQGGPASRRLAGMTAMSFNAVNNIPGGVEQGMGGLPSRPIRTPSPRTTTPPKTGAGKGCICGCNSFSADTPVWTRSGLVAIAALAIGTPVLAFNEQTREQGYYPITQVFENQDPAITGLVIEDPETRALEYITTTPEHPFYVTERSDTEPRPKPEGHSDLSDKWVGAGHLKVGDKLKQADGTLGEVRYVNTIQEARTMYNLEVEEAHTFFVGTQGWLVHNGGTKNCWDPIEIEPKSAYDFEYPWIQKKLYNELDTKAGSIDAKKLKIAMTKGIVAPEGNQGIKILTSAEGKYTHELKINGSANRILGRIVEIRGRNVLLFDKFVRGGLH